MKDFKPAWWCPGAHTQTIFARFFRPVKPLKLQRQRFETPDGDFIDVDFLEGAANAPLILILHGLEGSSEAPYVRSLLGEIRDQKWQAAVLNFRGCSGEPNRLRQTYHSGHTQDLDFLINALQKAKPGVAISLVGYSIGGNVILKWLGEQGTAVEGKVQNAVAVSVPYDLVKAAECLDRGFNREIYTRRLLSTLKQKMQDKEKRFPGLLPVNKIKTCRTFQVFDREVTARLNGFKDEMDYWVQSSSSRYLSAVQIRTLLIHAQDDPFFPGCYLPLETIQNSEVLELLTTPKGGHLGFVAGAFPWKQELWLEARILEFLSHDPSITH